MMDLQAMARDLSLKLEAAGFPKSEAANRQVLNLAEEVGEFVGAYRRWKGMARRTGSFEGVAKELADVVITAFVTAEELGITLESEIAAKLEVIYSRGWHEGGRQAEQAQPRRARVWFGPEGDDPGDVEKVTDRNGDIWTRKGYHLWVCAGIGAGISWESVQERYGPLTEVVKGGDV